MSTDDKYNGWTNRETWAVSLHINNDEGWQESVMDALREAVGEIVMTADGYVEQDVPLKPWEAGVVIKENVEETLDASDDPSMRTADLLAVVRDIGSLWRVDWDEIGASFLSDLGE